MVLRYVCLIVTLTVATGSASRAQEAKPDTVRLVRIGDSLRVLTDTTTIFHPGAVIMGTRAAGRRSANTVQRVSPAAIRTSDAASVADAARLIPSAHVQTNSRGETLLYLRNAGERQVAVYFDGALINVPWDNRVDLDMVPTSALESISVSKGSASSEFGPNLMGGAVNLVSKDLGRQGRVTEATFEAGSGEMRRFEGMHMGRSTGFSYLAAVGYLDREGLSLPHDVDLPFSQTDSGLRTNTDLRRLNVLVRGEYFTDVDLTVSLAALVIDAKKGIAPEGHIDPTDGGVRFWRYPDWTSRMLIATVGRPPAERRAVSYRGSVWVHDFGQRIAAYDSEAFSYLTDEEKDDDVTIGGRVVVGGDFSSLGVRFSVGATYASHDQIDTEFSPPELQLPPRPGPKQHYKQVLMNTGLEADYRYGATVYSAGVNLDSRSVLDADVFEEPGSQIELGARAGVIYQISRSLEWTISTGRRSRFPTLREQFSGALGRFVVNPELRSERAWLSESSLRLKENGLALDATVFLTLTTNTIDQTVVEVEGASRRKRVNLEGSRNFGIELNGSYRVIPQLTVSMDATVSRLRAEDPATGTYDRPLTERPENRGTLRLHYIHRSGVSAMLESEYVGKAFSLDEDGSFVELRASTVFNIRGAYRFDFSAFGGASAELYLRSNNVGDVVVENQLGLPGPGRTTVGGLKVTL